MSGPSTATTLVSLHRLHGRRAQLVLEHRQLAKDISRSEGGERDRAPVGVLANRTSTARAHDVARIACVALSEHDLPWLKAARHRQLRDPPKVVLLERREHRHASEQLHYLRSLCGSHALEISQARPLALNRATCGHPTLSSQYGSVEVDRAVSARRRFRADADSQHSLLHSRELWATVDVCNPKDQPNTVGIRGSMPGDGMPKTSCTCASTFNI